MSVTFRQATKANIDRAIAKAQQAKPRIIVQGFNDFLVIGSKGDRYNVKFSGKGEDFTAHCQCRANLENLVCYHTCAAASVYKLQVIAGAAERTCPGCGANEDLGDTCTCVATLAVEAAPAVCRTCHEAEAEIDGLCPSCMDAKVREDFADIFGHN